MFTGILQGTASVVGLEKTEGLGIVALEFEDEFCTDLQVGASVSVDGVCLTATKILSNRCVSFDVIWQSLYVTTLKNLELGLLVNVERAAKDGAEVGGHYISGHVDFSAEILHISHPHNNHVLRINIPPHWGKYIFSKGYLAINGASLTVSDVSREESWFEIWLIPETLRVTNFCIKKAGHYVNVEVERSTQVLVDTVRSTIEENFNRLLPTLSNTLSITPLLEDILIENLKIPSFRSPDEI